MDTDKKTVVASTPDLTTYLWEKGEELRFDIPVAVELLHREIHVRPSGTNEGDTTLILVYDGPNGLGLISQISLGRIWPAIEAAIKAKGPLM